MWRNFHTVFLISDEIIESSKWKGSFICPRIGDTRSPEEKQFEHDHSEHLRLYVDPYMSSNEFIIMLRNRFFNNDNGYDDIELEDIWLYKIIQT